LNVISVSAKKLDSDAMQILLSTLLNNKYFSQTIYKLDLKLQKGKDSPLVLINETNTNGNVYNNNITNYLKGTYVSNNKRGNDIYFYVGDDSNNYYATLYDQATLLEINDQGFLINTDRISYSNNIEMSFKITHNAPEGESYGKDYGRQNSKKVQRFCFGHFKHRQGRQTLRKLRGRRTRCKHRKVARRLRW
jgi:hypothetical protein